MRLLLVDDDPLILSSLEIKLGREADMDIAGCASDGAKAVELCKTEAPDVVLMDIRMPGMDGISATGIIKSRFPHIHIMMLTTFDDKQNIQHALAAGADGYLLKTDKIDQIAGKLRLMVSGTGVLDAGVLRKLVPQENPALGSLTPRERNIARLVAQGLTNKEISAVLFLSEGTVRNHLVVIMEKLGVTNRTRLGMVYFEQHEQI